MKKLTQKQFVEKANIIHNFKFDYSNSLYINHASIVTIRCLIHGEFDQIANKHLSGRGCKRCAGLNKSNSDFILEANIKHDYKYLYDKTKYKSCKENIVITCLIHGDFEQTPDKHLTGHGCSQCGKSLKLTIKQFIARSNIVHNNTYNYSLVDYKNNSTNISIICEKHGIFEQIPSNHMSGHGCPRCCHIISKKEQKWICSLNNVNIKPLTIKINNKRYNLDGYDSATNTAIYEFYGDFWHGNPEIYNSENINNVKGVTFGECYNNTINRENELKQAGYKIISIWENEYDKYTKF